MANSEILKIFKDTEALLEGHFLLTSGKHSDKYFQCAKVLQYPKRMEVVCAPLAEHFRSAKVDKVISPAMGGILVGQEVARQLDKPAIFAERENGRLCLRRGFSLSKGERVLVCEDVVTTGGSVMEVLNIVKSYGAVAVGVAMIVDRSGGNVDFGISSKSALCLSVKTYEAEDCPLCAEGSKPYKPGSRKID